MPLGILLGLAFLGVGIGFLPFALAFAAGTFLFVAAVDLIPELQHRTRSPLVAAMILAGFVSVAALTALLPGS
jgi:zinc transporter ZupT